jgi:predicted nucleic acid-binding protein
MRVFIDTNLWAYRLDRREPEKAERLKPWLAAVAAEHDIVISTGGHRCQPGARCPSTGGS